MNSTDFYKFFHSSSVIEVQDDLSKNPSFIKREIFSRISVIALPILHLLDIAYKSISCTFTFVAALIKGGISLANRQDIAKKMPADWSFQHAGYMTAKVIALSLSFFVGPVLTVVSPQLSIGWYRSLGIYTPPVKMVDPTPSI